MDAITRNRCFLKVVETGGFSSAARDMGRSKALVSKYVSELEDELGARLLNRTTRQVSLTPTGEAYAREISELLQRFDDLKNSVQFQHGEVRGRMRVSAPRSMADSIFVRAIMEFLSLHPHVQIDLQLDDRIVDIVEEGYDLAIRATELSDSSLIARKIHDIRGVFCASPAFLEQYGTPQHPSELSKIPCVVDNNYRFKSAWVYQENGERQNVNVQGPLAVNSADAARQAALAGLGVIRLPITFVYQEIERGDLQLILEDFEGMSIGVYAVYANKKHLSAKVRALVDFILDYTRRAEESGNCPKLLR
ncbi:LysR family transcriptional regulator [Polycladidibacter hongkongensis]|uniref:LysR family transcriptional regulator n=1 Tax=Polycladidibacter hongkongensis TaxID=1647556 RepID=UPI0008360B1D|nr:LysR family transcriptional regulator [Pseudovibrio hongkongensis]